MILCARSTSRSREQNTKRRPGSENMLCYVMLCYVEVCYGYSQNNEILWLSNMADKSFFRDIHEVRKGLWAFFSWLCFMDAYWLSRQTQITWYWRHAQLSVCVSIICMYDHPLFNLTNRPSIHPSIYASIYAYMHACIHPSVHPYPSTWSIFFRSSKCFVHLSGVCCGSLHRSNVSLFVFPGWQPLVQRCFPVFVGAWKPSSDLIRLESDNWQPTQNCNIDLLNRIISYKQRASTHVVFP